jgi:hypothetical protein
MKKSIILTVLLASLFIGCKSAEDVAYKSTGVVVVTVASAMNAYRDACSVGLIASNKQDQVRAIYNKYYGAVQVERSAIESFKSNTNTNDLYKAVAAVSAASADVISLIEQFLPPDRLLKLKGK